MWWRGVDEHKRESSRKSTEQVSRLNCVNRWHWLCLWQRLCSVLHRAETDSSVLSPAHSEITSELLKGSVMAFQWIENMNQYIFLNSSSPAEVYRINSTCLLFTPCLAIISFKIEISYESPRGNMLILGGVSRVESQCTKHSGGFKIFRLAI